MGLPAIAIQLGVSVGLWAIDRYLLRDEGPKLPKPKPDGLEFANNTVGTPHAYIAGTVRVDNLALSWHGNHVARADASGRFTYGADMLFTIGVPIWDEATAPWSSWRSSRAPKVRRIWYGDKEKPVLNMLHGVQTSIVVDLGGDLSFSATGQFFDGRSTQTLLGTLTRSALNRAGIVDGRIPGYRHKMMLALLAADPKSGLRIGYSPRVPAIGVEVSAIGPEPPGTNGIDANPAWVLYDILCRPVWGIGIDPDDVDLTSFEDAADTLVTEDHGCSVVIHRPEEAAKILLDVLSQIDAVMYLAPSTGKIKLKLIRADYDVGTIPHLTADNVLGGNDRPELDHTHERFTANEVRVHFTDRSRGYKPDTATAQKLANAAARDNRRRPLDFHAPGCMTATLARAIAARELAIHGRPLMTLRATVNREFYDLELGDAVKVTLAQYNLSAAVFRVLEVDTGQRADGAIRLMLVEDVFGVTSGGLPVPEPDPLPTIYPLTERYLDEAPRYMAYLAALAGAIPNLGEQRLLACAVEEDDDATQFAGDTTAGGPGGIYTSFVEQSDVPLHRFPTTCTVATAYPRTLEPYDTTTGLVVENVSGEFASTFTAFTATASQIINEGYNLFVVGGGPGQVGEIIAFESVTDLGGGQYRLNNVWRGLPDTVPVDHAVGARLYHLTIEAVGRRDWITGQHARMRFLPGPSLNGSEDDAVDDILITPVGRRFLPMRAADLIASGYDLEGTSGVPAVAQTYPYLGGFKALSVLDAALDLSGRQNRIDANKVVRGDDTSWTADSGTDWDVYGQKSGEDEVALTDHADLAAPSTQGVLLAGTGLGHGTIDVFLRSKMSIGGTDRASWQSPHIRVAAATWRNLLASDSFDYGALLPGWTETSGTATIEEGTDSLPREATGRYWAQSETTSDCVLKQTIDVRGYKPIGLTAVLSFYGRSFGAAALAVDATIAALDASDSELDSATDSVTGPTDHWRRNEFALAIPADTAKISVELTLNAQSDPLSRAGATRIRLQLGQVTDELLANPSFDGVLTSWTNVTNSFVVNTGNPYSSRDGTIGAAQGGAFASSEIKQEVTIPAGYEYGVALLTGARSNAIADDTGEVVLEVLDGGGAVLDDATTGETVYTVDEWGRFRLALQLPDEAVTLRVRLLADRAAGAGNSGACFDDLSLRVHKDLDPVTTHDFDFSEPIWQPAPTTWQRFHLDFPTLPVPIMAWDGSSVTPTVQPHERLDGPEHAWSDAGTPDPASFFGTWDIGPDADEADDALEHVHTIDAYQFTREIAANAVDLQTSGPAEVTGDEYGAFTLDEDFAVAVLFRTDEPTWSTAAGLVGRRSDAGVGWGLRIDATGKLQAVLQGAGGTATATAANSIADRAPHWAILVNDVSAATLRLYDDHGGSATASTAGVGSLAASEVPLRIGRDSSAIGTGGLAIARVYVWRDLLEAADVAAILRLGDDPSGLLTTYSMNRSLWIPGPTDASFGMTLLRASGHHVAVGFYEERYGLVTVSASTNKIPSHDFSDTGTWTAETDATLTQGIVDATGLPRGVNVENTAGGEAIRCSGITMGVGTPLGVVFYARTTDGVNRTLAIELRDSSEAVIASTTELLTGAWSRYHVTLGPWANSTPTAILRFSCATAGASFDLANAMWAAFGSDAPFAIQDAGLAVTEGSRTRAGALPVQTNYEGELYVMGRFAVATPAADQSIVVIDESSNVEGIRALLTGTTGAPKFDLYDSAASLTSTPGTAIDWDFGFVLRGRWCSRELPESVGDQVGLVVEDSSTNSATYATLAFPVGTTALNTIYIGADANLGGSPNALIERVIVRTREPKLSG